MSNTYGANNKYYEGAYVLVYRNDCFARKGCGVFVACQRVRAFVCTCEAYLLCRTSNISERDIAIKGVGL